MGGSSSKAIIGYKYHLGLHMALCHGQIDTITEIQVDDKVAWTGETSGGKITVDAETLFGGDKREGGISGDVDIVPGSSSELPNGYLQSILGASIPAFRGVASAVLNQCYVGNNPYIKPWAFQTSRIHKLSDGLVQWYDEKSEVLRACGGSSCASLEEYFGSWQELSWAEEPTEVPFPSSESGATLGWTNGDSFGGNFATTQAGAGLGPDYCQGPSSWCLISDFADGVRDPGYITTNVLDENLVTMAAVIGPASGSTRITGTLFNNQHSISFVYNSVGGNSVDTRITVDASGVDSGGGVFTDTTITLKVWNVGGTGVHYTDSIYIGDASESYIITIKGNISDPIIESTAIKYDISASVCVAGVAFGTQTMEYENRITRVSGGTIGAVSSISVRPTWFFYACDLNLYGIHVSQLGVDYDCEAALDSLQGFVGGPCNDMNPAHIIRECLTEPWGLGYTPSDVDDDSFTAAADALHESKFGLSLVWDKEVELEDFITTILSHIDAVLYVSRDTGKFTLKLIRDDYDVGDLLTIDGANAKAPTNATRPALSDLTTSVTVQFTDCEANENTGSITVHNEALTQLQGAERNATLSYPGIMTRELAYRVALRELKQLSTPLVSAEFECNRQAAGLNIGDAFVANFPDQGFYDLVMRVQGIELGDGVRNPVKIEAIEDAFGVPGFEDAPDLGAGGGWTDPTTLTPLPSDPTLLIEAPYYELVLDRGQLAVDAILDDDAEAGFIMSAGGRQANEINADLLVDAGGGYEVAGTLEFAPYAYLVSELSPTDEVIYYTLGKDLDVLPSGELAQINGEIIRVDSFDEDSAGTFMNVGRGCLDTVPVAHTPDSNGTPIIFFSQYPVSDEVQYAMGETVDVKILPYLGSSRVDEADATADSVTLDSRAIRPYPPGDLKVDGESYPNPIDSSAAYYTGAHTITWVHRDRLQQTGGEVNDHFDGSIGPEAGTTYKVEAYSTLTGGATSDVWLSTNVGSSTIFEQDSNTDSNMGTPPEDSETVHFRVTSVRGGYESWQSPEAVLVCEQFDSIGPPFDSAGVSDPYFSSVKLLLHFDGSDGSTSIIDSSPSPVTVSVNSDAQIDTAFSKFGGSSLLISATSDAISFPGLADLGAGDWTLEWFYRSSGSPESFARIFQTRDGDFVCGIGINQEAFGQIKLYVDATGTGGWDYSSAAISFSTATWQHYALVRNAGTINLYIDGVSYASTTVTPADDSAQTWIIGGQTVGTSRSVRGNFDEVRFTNGAARYTSSFTPPSAEFPDS